MNLKIYLKANIVLTSLVKESISKKMSVLLNQYDEKKQEELILKLFNPENLKNWKGWEILFNGKNGKLYIEVYKIIKNLKKCDLMHLIENTNRFSYHEKDENLKKYGFSKNIRYILSSLIEEYIKQFSFNNQKKILTFEI